MKNILFAFGVCCCLAGCDVPATTGLPTPVASGAATPEAAFEAGRRAIEQNDWQAYSRCLSSATHDSMSRNWLHVLIMQRGLSGPEFRGWGKMQPIVDALAKHGIDDASLAAAAEAAPEQQKAAIDGLLAKVSNKQQLVGDLIPAAKAAGMPIFTNDPAAKLGPATITGDTATAQLEFNAGGQAMQWPMNFRKEAGGWKIDFSELLVE